eukprot:13522765-Ditylum_brightwellii.AAC.1
MEKINEETDTVELNTPVPSEKNILDDDENGNVWDDKTVVLDYLVVELLSVIENDPFIVINEILIRLFMPQKNIITAKVA